MTTKTKGQDGGNRLTPKTSDSQEFKPEIDLLTWAKLGSNALPSRDRRTKKSWRRAKQ